MESPRRPLFVFLCDTCLIEEELQFVRSAIESAIKLLPSNSMIGFISFWNYVQVHELGLVHPENAYIFQGTKEVTKQQMEYQLGQLQGFGLLDRFFIRVSDCGLTLLPDYYKRASRCTGVAFSVAARLLEACQAGTSARIIALVGGPCTEGPGMIVSKDLSEPMRSNHDLRGHALHFHKAVEFYKNLSSILVNQGHVLNIFACSPNQKGPSCADTFIGEGNTALWKICRLDKSTCFTVFFDVSPRDKLNPLGTLNPQLYLQFLTNYQSLRGETRIRSLLLLEDGLTCRELYLVSKMLDLLSNLSSAESYFTFCFTELLASLDQETAIVVMARLISFKMEMEVSDYSPNETAYVRMFLNRESVSTLSKLLPFIIRSTKSISCKMMGALIDEAFQIQLLDAYFCVVIFYEREFAKLRGGQDHAGMLEAVHGAARFIISKRFRVPHLVECDQDDAQNSLSGLLHPSTGLNPESILIVQPTQVRLRITE
ncbi:hypothetical protein Sjap_008864 [Stephania japonica]|uniref:Protein transport protein SEC23 n=1 Tax=Stephania japonica TaxID=461633 RepID=A0AAP0JSN9_9MAGN